MDKKTDPYEPGSPEETNPSLNPGASLLTVSQAYDYLITEGLPRSKKTIRKWCRLGHVEIKQNVIPGGAKWLIVESSLDARIAEERLIDASLSQETGSNGSERVPVQTSTNPSVPVRDDELVEVLREQPGHERSARKAVEDKNADLIRMYHEISMASTQLGIEIGKGMQEQGKARQLGREGDPGSNRSGDAASIARTVPLEPPDDSPTPGTDTGVDERDNGGDNSEPRTRILRVQ
jgi:hypothetical protein